MLFRGCEHDARMAVTREVFDADPLVVGVPGGSVDLRNGVFEPADPSRFILRRTGSTPAPPGTTAPL